jgi:CRISPR-associated protein Csm2
MSIQTIMTADESGAELVNFARATAQRLVKDRLTRSQIRNIFTEVRQIEAMWPSQDAMRRLNMLKPKLSYSTARSSQVQQLETVLVEAISLVDQAPNDEERNKRFQRFMDLFEAILAYHRAEGGRS